MQGRQRWKKNREKGEKTILYKFHLGKLKLINTINEKGILCVC